MVRLVLLLLLVMTSGAVALTHELLWTRRLVDVLGATPLVTGRVLGLFFLGLSLGSWIAVRFPKWNVRPLSLLAGSEFLIGILVLPALFVAVCTDWIWPLLGPNRVTSVVGNIVKLVIACLVVVPPATVIGMTLPLFLRVAIQICPQSWHRFVPIWFYAINTMGGVAGLLLTSTWVLPTFGVFGAMFLATATNVLLGVILFVCDRQWARESETSKSRRRAGKAIAFPGNTIGLNRPILLFLAFLSGFFVLAYEVLALRLLDFVVPSSLQSTSALLASVILLFVASSLLAMICRYWTTATPSLMAIALVLAAVAIVYSPQLLYLFTNELVSIRYLNALDGRVIPNLEEYWGQVFVLVTCVSGMAFLLLGLIFPLLLSSSTATDESLHNVGTLFAVNGVGGLLGCEVANLGLLSNFGVYESVTILAVGSALAAGLVCSVVRLWTWKVAIAVFSAVTLLGFGGLGNSRLPYLSPNEIPKSTIVFEAFGSDGVLLITIDAHSNKRMLLNNQYVLGTSSASLEQRRQLMLPWLLHGDVKSACCLGFATGISAGALEGTPTPPAIDAIELSELVAETAKIHFATENHRFFSRPENRVIPEDARTFIAATRNRYDLIVGDLFRPHGFGEGRLYSREHFENVRIALKNNGVFCQWLPLHQLTLRELKSVVATFRCVFPDVLLLYASKDSKTPVLGLVGTHGNRRWQPGDLQRIVARTAEPGAWSECLIEPFTSYLGGWIPTEFDRDSKINTLDNALVEFAAGEFWVLKDLRPKRPPDNLENGFLSHENWAEFRRELSRICLPIGMDFEGRAE
jgi:spermidine synthase